MTQKSNINLFKVYDSSYAIYCRMFDLISLLGAEDKVPSELYALRDSNGVLSKISFKILIVTRKTGLLNTFEYRQYFDNILPKFLMNYGVSERLYRVKAEGWREALIKCVENNLKLSSFLLYHIKNYVEIVVNTSVEHRHYMSEELRKATYHRVVKLHDKFFLEWNKVNTLCQLAFLYTLPNYQQSQLEYKLTQVYQNVINTCPQCILNVFLYTQFKDDINSVSVQFPYESINEFQLGKYVTQHIESIMIPQALMDEYEVFSVKLSEYHKSDQLDQISNNNSK